MVNPARNSTPTLIKALWGASFLVTLVFALIMMAAQSAQAQTFTVLHSFSGLGDGDYP